MGSSITTTPSLLWGAIERCEEECQRKCSAVAGAERIAERGAGCPGGRHWHLFCDDTVSRRRMGAHHLQCAARSKLH